MKKIQFSLIVACLCVTMAPLESGAQTNIAPNAVATTSYVSPWETIAALNDGFTPAS